MFRRRFRRFGIPLMGGGAAATPALTLTATTTGASKAVTIHRMTPATGKSLTIDWGDGDTTTVEAGDWTSKPHTYAEAGTYAVRVTDPLDIVQIDLHDAPLSGFKSAEVKDAEIVYFICSSLGGEEPSVINSADMSAWNPTTWWLYSMPATGTYYINSADMSAWEPTGWYMYLMPATGTYYIDIADMSTWNPIRFKLYSLPPGVIVNITAAVFAGWVKCYTFSIQDNGLLTAQVDALLWGLYQAAISRTTAYGGTLLAGGTNQAPTGVFQPASACPVSVATPGKEITHELLNDGCNGISADQTWDSITITV